MSHLVLAETLWVLDAVYERTPAQLAKAIDLLLNHKNLMLQSTGCCCCGVGAFPRASFVGFL